MEVPTSMLAPVVAAMGTAIPTYIVLPFARRIASLGSGKNTTCLPSSIKILIGPTILDSCTTEAGPSGLKTMS